MAAKQALLAIDNLSYAHSEKPLFSNISFSLNQGESLAILGPSGSGKSTLLKIISGLYGAVPGVTVKKELTEPTAISIILQDYGLFPWKRVYDNIRLPYLIHKKEMPSSLVDFLQLTPLLDKWPNQLSGGEKQRVALARALAMEPALLLLDEPFAALDFAFKARSYDLLKNLWQKQGFAMIVVTHDIPEALQLGQRILVLQKDGYRLLENKTFSTKSRALTDILSSEEYQQILSLWEEV